MDETSKQISVAESVVMEALWRTHPLTAEDIIAEIAEPQNWSAATVKSLLNRLVTKQAVMTERDGRRFLYSPRLMRADYVSAEGRGLLDRLFNGKVSALVTHFSQHEKLSAGDIAELKRMIQELDDDT